MALTFPGMIVKFFLIILNAITMLLGGVIAYIGLKLLPQNSDENVKELLNFISFRIGSFALIICAMLIIITSTIGLIGACLEKSLLLDIYGYTLFILIGLELILYSCSYLYEDKLKQNLEKGIKEAIAEYDKDFAMVFALQLIQSWFQCCGWNDYKDFPDVQSLPSSCCNQMDGISISNAKKSCQLKDLYYHLGCKNSPFITKVFGSYIFASYALGFLQICILLAACCLSRDIRLAVPIRKFQSSTTTISAFDEGFKMKKMDNKKQQKLQQQPQSQGNPMDLQ